VHGVGIQEDDIALFVLSRIIGNFTPEDEVEFTTDMLVTRKGCGSGVRINAVKNQFAFSFARQASHGKAVAEVSPGETVQRLDVDSYIEQFFDRSMQHVPDHSL
jgi:hypothetical protein